MTRCLSNTYTFEDMAVKYTTNAKTFEVKYNEYFKVNGEVMDTDYARYESAYVDGKIERKAEIIQFAFHGESLTLNFKEGTREFENEK